MSIQSNDDTRARVAVTVPVDTTATFVGTYGTGGFAVCDAGAPLGSNVAINGSTDLSDYIQFSGNGFVQSMSFIKAQNGIYNMEVVVQAQGPSGLGSGYGYLYFFDNGGVLASLKIFDSSLEQHTVQWQSPGSRLIAVAWAG